ncbi:MAG: hypothetical protein K2Z81_10155 [Cyanobacteria bacterium]|nr:hypothetical protein [Cyanobacteriota bacterium]
MMKLLRVFILYLSISVQCTTAAFADSDAIKRWQEEDARNQQLDRQRQLLNHEVELKRDIFELDQAIAGAVRKRANKLQDLSNVQHELMSAKLRML